MTIFKPPANWMTIKTLDAHTGGEPLRIILDGLPEIKGNTILEKRRFFKDHLDHIRTGLMWEPRGHADQYGAVITPPVSNDGDIGVFFLHNEGYSTMCGHAVIALGKALLDTGILKKEGNQPVIKMDTPAGRVVATAFRKGSVVSRVSFLNVPSFVTKSHKQINLPGTGQINYDIAFGGAFYAFCDAEQIGVGLDGKDHDELMQFGKRIKKAVIEVEDIIHPFEKDLGFLYGTIFIGKAKNNNHHSRNVCIFAEGEVDRSPTGTGVSARAAIHYSKGEIQLGETITIESILGTTMSVKVKEVTRFGDFEAVIPEVSGTAFITGENTFFFDPQDDLNKGFIFR
ncbi:MAG: proline racemase family protein [Bacteroidota bacterium]